MRGEKRQGELEAQEVLGQLDRLGRQGYLSEDGEQGQTLHSDPALRWPQEDRLQQS